MSTTVFKIIQEDLEILEQELRNVVKTPMDLITDISTHLVNSGGKRLRPALFLLGAKTGDYNREKCLPLALSLELIHMASLVHDDVLDISTIRRGKMTANARFGNKVAILTGDFLFSLALKNALGRGYVDNISLQVANLVADLSMGEILQDTYAYKGNISLQDYLLRIEKKTANFFATCIELGAIVAKKDDDFVKRVRKYGHLLGMAFQITDDILDLVGKVEATGKEKGSDIRQGIITLPIIRAFEVSSQKERLLAILIDKNMTDEMVEEVLDIVSKTDSIAYTNNMLDKYLEEAKEALPKEMSGDIKAVFIELADFVASRDF